MKAEIIGLFPSLLLVRGGTIITTSFPALLDRVFYPVKLTPPIMYSEYLPFLVWFATYAQCLHG